MAPPVAAEFRGELLDRRHKLESTIAQVGNAPDLVRLLGEVDAALGRVDRGSYGDCELCRGSMLDDPWLRENPLATYCLCELDPAQQRALEHDLELASRVQLALLPRQDLLHAGWEVHYRYLPAGMVSGDYCDVVPRDGKDGASGLHFALGDVSGKGVAASFLMARLNALIRTLVDTGLPVDQVLDRANRLVNEKKIASQFATLVLGHARPDGEVEVVNAGHCRPLIVRRDKVEAVETGGFPVGIVGTGTYRSERLRLAPGDTLFLYTDGLSEAGDASEEEFGAERIERALASRRGLGPAALAAGVLAEVEAFAGGTRRLDDLTVMVLRRSA